MFCVEHTYYYAINIVLDYEGIFFIKQDSERFLLHLEV